MSHFKLEWVDKFLRYEPEIIFDVGTYNGNQAMLFKRAYTRSRVIAIEADNRLFSKMILNTKLSEIEIYNFAICEKDGEVDFHHNEGTKKGSGSVKKPSSSIFKFEGMKFSEPKKVSGLRLDSFCKKELIKKIDILHMDIQSAEYEAIIGLGEMRPSMIFLEVSALKFYENTNDARNLLEKMSYQKINIEEFTKGDELWILKQ